MPQKLKRPRKRYGIGEWYGNHLVATTQPQRRQLAKKSLEQNLPHISCPFRSTANQDVFCDKRGGVCSLRLYGEGSTSNEAIALAGPEGSLVTTCPRRFVEDNRIFTWVGEVLLGYSTPLIAPEVAFLTAHVGGRNKNVGKIDCVLAHPTRDPLHWCALEMQAVYFSGLKMRDEFEEIRD
ncbi:MAG: hypothetical protein HYX73_06395, partial [Acidobacteria bacterium]|nr:hypothetical protein [Acidobacteriota bacterium]